MSPVVIQKPPLWQRLRPVWGGFDGWLALAVLILACMGLVVMYSVGYDHGTRFTDHGRNMLLALLVLLLISQIPPQRLMLLAVPLYTTGVLLLLGVELFGITKKGATRWINVGIVIQPSELMKIAMPMMLAWWFQKREGSLRPLDFAVAGLILAVPSVLILKQPDLGTTLLVMAWGLFVIFFAGLSWRLIVPPLLLMLALTAVSQFGLQPWLAQLKAQALPREVMESVLRDRFATWHGISSILYLLQSVLGLLLDSLVHLVERWIYRRWGIQERSTAV